MERKSPEARRIVRGTALAKDSGQGVPTGTRVLASAGRRVRTWLLVVLGKRNSV